MYSVVLMMAVAGGSEAPDIGKHRGGGCEGYAAGCGCHGGGGGRHGLLGGMLAGHRHGGGGCHGGGYGGCSGGGYGMGSGGCSGGATYGGGYPAGGMMAPGGRAPEDVKKMPKPEGGTGGTGGTKPPEETNLTPATAPATLIVSLPADAKLTIDDNATSSTTGRRVFVTPSLATGREYHYSLKAEVVRDGKPVVVSKVVAVRPGEQTEVSLSVPATSVAAR